MAWLSNALGEASDVVAHDERSGGTSRTCASAPSRHGDVSSVDVRSLPPSTLVTVDTNNSRYRLMLLGGEKRKAFVQGGRLFPEQIEGRVDGSTLGGSLLHAGWIDVGLLLEMTVGGKRIVTSRVRSIGVDMAPAGDAVTPEGQDLARATTTAEAL